jgi:hypothetical protein
MTRGDDGDSNAWRGINVGTVGCRVHFGEAAGAQTVANRTSTAILFVPIEGQSIVAG